ncbi:MAG: hypothetical protein IKR81_16845 [Victivallales bacterium]|nr:hypothetical protein [Victivallales bacterium]
MSIFDEGRAALAAAAEAASEEITLTPASGNATTLQARIGRKLFSTFNGAVPVNVMARRFIVKVADLASLPTRADTITWRGRTYRLGCPDGGAPWRYHGNDNQCIAIYATDFGTASNS